MGFLSKRILITTILIVITLSLFHTAFIFTYYHSIRARYLKQTLSELETVAKDNKDIFLANTILEQGRAIEMLEEEIRNSRGLQIVDWKCNAPNTTNSACSTAVTSHISNGVLERTQSYSVDPQKCCSLTLGRNASSFVSHTEYLRHIYLLAGFAGILILVIGIGITTTIKAYFTKPIGKIFEIIDDLAHDRLDVNMPTINNEFGVIINKLGQLGKTIKHSREKIANQSRLAGIGQISAHIAHDMRSPLSVLKSYVNYEPNARDEESFEYKKAVQRSIEKLMNMADDLIDYSKASKTERIDTELKQFLNDALVIEPNSTFSLNRINVEYIDCDNSFIRIDANKMERVLMNLINNAAQATSHIQGGINVKAGIFNKSDLFIAVSDDGKGIEAHHIPNIFDAFFTAGKKGGTGLGLSYCKQVVEAHGGTIDVQSEVGKGTTFTIRIPNCVVKKEMKIVMSATDILKYAGKRFLLVDDDENMRLVWRRKIEDNGGHVMCEMDSAHKTINNEKDIHYESIDTAIVDYKFPDSNVTGIDVVKYLKSKGVKEIYLCTGYADDPDIKNRPFVPKRYQ